VNLFPDQLELVDDVRAAMRLSKSVLVVSPTGSGKTRIATHMIEAAKNKDRTIIFTVPRKSLLEQTSNTFTELGISHSFIAAGRHHNPFSRVYIGMIDTMARRLDRLPKCDLLIVDETHFGEGALDSVIKHYKAANSWVLGLSATPWKTSGKGLGCWFDSMVVGKSIAWLIENKRLSDYRLFYGRTKADFSALKVSNGEFTQSSAAGYMESQGVIIGDCVRDYRERCMGRIHTVRCASIKHSQLVAEQFRNDGIAAIHVDGTTDITELRRIFQAWARRELLVVTFCDLLGFGFDLAQASGVDVCIESGSDLKPSLSLSGQMQYWGRLLRYKDFPAIINDHVNNYMTHGYPDDDRGWTLEDREQSKRAASEKTIAVKQCDRCFFAHRPAPICPSCGNVYPIQSREIDEVEGVLVEATKEERAAKKIEFKKARQSARSYNELVALGKSRNMSNPHGWAINIMKARGK
jgi:DNA repair protein RadD